MYQASINVLNALFYQRLDGLTDGLTQGVNTMKINSPRADHETGTVIAAQARGIELASFNLLVNLSP